jgi:hypothetical protein
VGVIGKNSQGLQRLGTQKASKSLIAGGIRGHPFSDEYGTEVPYAEAWERFIFLLEQFWGRAARASQARKSLGAPVIFGFFCRASCDMLLPPFSDSEETHRLTGSGVAAVTKYLTRG